jgi:hypothetical protein
VLEESVSIDPETVVKDPLGSVDMDGGILVTEKLCEAEPEGKVSMEPDIVVREPFGSVDVVGGILVIDKFAGRELVELPGKLDTLKGFVFVPDMKLLGDTDPLEPGLDRAIEDVDSDVELAVETGPDGGMLDVDPDTSVDGDSEGDEEDVGVEERLVGDVSYL